VSLKNGLDQGTLAGASREWARSHSSESLLGSDTVPCGCLACCSQSSRMGKGRAGMQREQKGGWGHWGGGTGG
jgi:hypothetical protein